MGLNLHWGVGRCVAGDSKAAAASTTEGEKLELGFVVQISKDVFVRLDCRVCVLYAAAYIRQWPMAVTPDQS